MNEDVPPETILKYVIKEKYMLQLEVEQLRAKLRRKDEAIAAFKKWQSRMAQYKCRYWLSAGMKLLEEQPDEERFKEFRNLVSHYESFELHFRLAEHNYNKVQKDRERLKRFEDLDKE